MIFTKEEFNTLKEADAPLRKYHFGKYVTGCSSALVKRLLAIYRRITGDASYICTNCAGGMAVIFKKLAPMYLDALAEEKVQKQRRKNGNKKNLNR